MEHIWAPWRIEYILEAKDAKGEGCILCQKPKENKDEANLILHRGRTNFIMLNAFPYNPGHLMVAPYRHIGKLEDLNDDESKEHFDLIKLSVRLLKEAVQPTGFNTGMNLGKIAGAGIEEHVHTHIVPRWQGDTNFMPVVADTKVLPQALATSYSSLKKSLESLL
ncbi:MAG: HIT domain-containing protein [Chloroflexi bacterium]|nr:HIT domain-containing protein [Chloroflexota bacterium]MBM3154994.1 HIT domain-containing protein [Chloroflexota bacterium]MBM3172916.1 HIT domain-containing protein [Chloroflexota bacterium]MBM3175246.1 HIT domain-containing protein [Chloroflexota bacterium]MBM4451206.1 HIT domain-containing protein [Chloroflexota bacterium]